MASSYNPDAEASPVPPLAVAILSQRDLEVEIPIDKAVAPSISVKVACFNNNVYDLTAAEKCLANLLAVGYRRFALDVYWDPTSRQWSVCPVQSSRGSSAGRSVILKRANSFVTRQSSAGQITCSGNPTLDFVGSVLADYLKSTSTNLGARTTVLTLSVKAAAPLNGTVATLNSTTLPNNDQQLNEVLHLLSGDLYTPAMLRTQRDNLNSSWLGSPESPSPDLAYITTSLNSQGQLMTSTGWPNVGLVAFQKRLVVGLGPISDEMRNYNLTGDQLVYHNTTSITNLRSVDFDSSGISQGCLFDASGTDLALSSQWQLSGSFSLTNDQTSQSVIQTVSNLTLCGISPVVNRTTDSSAQISLNTHLSVIQSAIWSWAANEPRNVSSTENNADRLRCALQDMSLSGRWKVVNCDEQHYSACRSNSNPLMWKFSSSKGSYMTRETSCPPGTNFGAPRTALENRYLANAFSQFQSSQPSAASEAGPWVDFNALNVQNCWVQGAKTTCPYNSDGGTKRQVVIPIVAAVIVLVIAALLVFVKCAANRRNIRRGRKRRGKDDVGEYEGVPS